MSLRIILDLTENDLEHFRALARKAMAKREKQPRAVIVQKARELLKQVDDRIDTDFIRSRLSQLQILIDMLEDEGWGMQEIGQGRVLTALAYFADPEDLIPDNIPGIGLLDDAIMVELICRELKPEIDAYRDFVRFRASAAQQRGVDPAELNREDFVKSRERALLGRMRRRRRMVGSGSGGGGKSPFSLF